MARLRVGTRRWPPGPGPGGPVPGEPVPGEPVAADGAWPPGPSTSTSTASGADPVRIGGVPVRGAGREDLAADPLQRLVQDDPQFGERVLARRGA